MPDLGPVYNPNDTPSDMTVFDEQGFTCISSKLGTTTPWWGLAADCTSPHALDKIITLVSTTPTPDELHGTTIHYLGYRGGHSGPDGTQPDVAPVDREAFTDNYYDKIDAPGSLGQFKIKYGFIPGATETTAVYYNAADLGLGRNMHCKSFTVGTQTGKACYVGNFGRTSNTSIAFGPEDLDPQTAIAQAVVGVGSVQSPGQVIATVAMVYDPSISPASARVQFMVYDAFDTLTPYAALDHGGVLANVDATTLATPTNANITVPDNCLTCHGTSSSYTPSISGPSTVFGAYFLPFDPEGFLFSTTNSTYSEANMLLKIKELNAHVYDTDPPAATIALLKGMYGDTPNGPKDVGSSFTKLYVPPGWVSQGRAGTRLYEEVVKPYCRTCHVSHDHTSGGVFGLDFVNFADFNNAGFLINAMACGGPSSGPMPQAEQTQRRFWKSSARAHLVNGLSLGGACTP